MGRFNCFSWLYSVQIGFLSVLFFGAIMNTILLSLGLSFAPGRPQGTIMYYQDVLSHVRPFAALLNSFMLAGITALIAVPLAIAVARVTLLLRSSLARLFVCGAVILPLFSSPILRILGLSTILSDNGTVASLTCGLFGSIFCLHLLYTVPAVVIGL